MRYFKRFVDDDMVDNLVNFTNIYSSKKNGVQAGTGRKELKQLIGTFSQMGLVKMPNNRMYILLLKRDTSVADIMSRNGFLYLLTVLHLVDNDEVPDDEKTDKLWKIRPWVSKFRGDCLKLVPEEYHSVGEQIWCRTRISGQLYDFDVYQGATADRGQEPSIGVSGDIVVKLKLQSHC